MERKITLDIFAYDGEEESLYCINNKEELNYVLSNPQRYDIESIYVNNIKIQIEKLTLEEQKLFWSLI